MAGEIVTPQISPNIVETKIGLVCIDIDLVNGQCKTWAVMKQPEPLLPNLTTQERDTLTISVVSFIVFVWVIVVFKKAINL